MVYPSTFGFNEQTAVTNAFQQKIEADADDITSKACREFDGFVEKLRSKGIHVTVFRDSLNPPKPDAVFPNNWISTWTDGGIYLYPMATESRRRERNQLVVDQLDQDFTVGKVVDLSGEEEKGMYLEGTGVLVFDHPNKLAYGVISPRCSEELFKNHVTQLGYKPVLFSAVDAKGQPVYHTNVVMGVQSTTAVICGEAIKDEAEREHVLSKLRQHQAVVDITLDQMNNFCGNVIEAQNDQGKLFLIMSRTAHDNFSPEQRDILSEDKELLPVDIPTIETIGGGSARCMVAEVFLPFK